MSGGTTTVYLHSTIRLSDIKPVNIKCYLTTETCLNIVHDSKICITFETFF